MPKLPVLSGADVVKMLERLGFEQIRQRGSHVVMRRGGIGTVGPLHKAGIIRQAGLTQDEFLKVAQ